MHLQLYNERVDEHWEHSRPYSIAILSCIDRAMYTIGQHTVNAPWPRTSARNEYPGKGKDKCLDTRYRADYVSRLRQ